MRTTVAIDDNVLAAARSAARRRGLTLGELVSEALRRELNQPVAMPAPPIPVFRGGGGPQPGVDLNSNRALAEFLDSTDHSHDEAA